MKFVHIADMHFDAPFSSLKSIEGLGDKRRLEQRSVFKKVIDYIKNNEIEYFFIAGDFYEHEYIRKSSIEYIINLFHEIPNTKVFITPGNHDPYIKNSFYETYNFGENVYIFHKSNIEKYEDQNVIIYGMAFTEFYMNESVLENIKLPESDKIKILVTHCDLNGSKDKDGFSYNPVLESKLSKIGFNYVAMGHVHNNNYNPSNKICYPGSTISLGFDELGEHGMIVGEITNSKFNTEFVKLDDREFKEIELDISEIISKEALIERIIDLKLKENSMYKIILVWNRNFEIDSRKLLKAVSNGNILKVKDKTKIQYDIEELAKQNNLKGIFIREAIKLYKDGVCTEDELQKAIEIGLDAMQ